MHQRRYLSPAEKAHELEQWFEMLTTQRWQPSSTPKLDSGLPDAEMVPWCLRLNRLPGICTLQSCAGHKRGKRHTSGHLWLRLDRRTSRAFDARASELAKQSGIESVSVLYRADGQTIASVFFQGNERGRLAVSMRTICSFFERISRSG